MSSSDTPTRKTMPLPSKNLFLELTHLYGTDRSLPPPPSEKIVSDSSSQTASVGAEPSTGSARPIPVRRPRPTLHSSRVSTLPPVVYPSSTRSPTVSSDVTPVPSSTTRPTRLVPPPLPPPPPPTSFPSSSLATIRPKETRRPSASVPPPPPPQAASLPSPVTPVRADTKDPATGLLTHARCCACLRIVPRSAFSQSQLKNRRRYRRCIECMHSDRRRVKTPPLLHPNDEDREEEEEEDIEFDSSSSSDGDIETELLYNPLVNLPHTASDVDHSDSVASAGIVAEEDKCRLCGLSTRAPGHRMKRERWEGTEFDGQATSLCPGLQVICRSCQKKQYFACTSIFNPHKHFPGVKKWYCRPCRLAKRLRIQYKHSVQVCPRCNLDSDHSFPQDDAVCPSIMCEGRCGNWYHHTCVGFTSQTLPGVNDLFVCPTCLPEFREAREQVGAAATVVVGTSESERKRKRVTGERDQEDHPAKRRRILQGEGN